MCLRWNFCKMILCSFLHVSQLSKGNVYNYVIMLTVFRIAAVRQWNVQWVALKVNALSRLKNNVQPTLNFTLKLTESINKNKHEIKTHCWNSHVILACIYKSLLSWVIFRSAPHCKCNAVPGELLSKFAVTKPWLLIMWRKRENLQITWSLQIMCYDKHFEIIT